MKRGAGNKPEPREARRALPGETFFHPFCRCIYYVSVRQAVISIDNHGREPRVVSAKSHCLPAPGTPGSPKGVGEEPGALAGDKTAPKSGGGGRSGAGEGRRWLLEAMDSSPASPACCGKSARGSDLELPAPPPKKSLGMGFSGGSAGICPVPDLRPRGAVRGGQRGAGTCADPPRARAATLGDSCLFPPFPAFSSPFPGSSLRKDRGGLFPQIPTRNQN